MIELLYNAVRAVGGEDINIIADITDGTSLLTLS